MTNSDNKNQTLTLSHIMEHVPYVTLPKQYFPVPSIGHQPPAFAYGVAFTCKYVRNFLKVKSKTQGRLDWMVAQGRFHEYFRKKFDRGIHLEVSETQETLVLVVKTNYSSWIPVDKRDNIIPAMEKLTRKTAKWYLINTRAFKENYAIPGELRTYVSSKR